MKTLCLVATSLALLAAGCADEGGDLVVRDAAGAVVATGHLRLPDRLPPVGQSFEGTWQLASAGGVFPTGAATSGTYTGVVHGRDVSIDLNPGVADNKVVLSGSVANGALTGRWRYETFAGRKDKGTFTVGRQPQ